MNKKNRTAVTPTRKENFPEWYQEVVRLSDLAESSPVRGCMVIKPHGYALWENMQRVLDDMFKATGHVNAYFPLLIPLSFFEKEAKHVEGFAKECAVVTHHRLVQQPDGKMKPDGELEEPYVIRPTSETIIGHSYAKWVQSYRDLPILINQWANVMRWEMRPRIFLRTAEFLWQEGHTVHATAEEAREETLKMLDVYTDFAENWMALPVIKGRKTEDEKFPGAVETYTLEAMMQDGKALQGCTSHFLGQNFAKSSEIKFLNKNGEQQYAWTTSWGATTRFIGAIIMAHGDDDGLVLPPKLAPHQVALCPIYKTEEEKERVLSACKELHKKLSLLSYAGRPVRCRLDDRDMRGGEKIWDHIKKGTPLRVEIGPRDLESSSVMLGRRDDEDHGKIKLTFDELTSRACDYLEEIHNNMFEKALLFTKNQIRKIDSLEEFEKFFTKSSKNQTLGFAYVHWHEDSIGHPLLEKLKVTPRCIPMEEGPLTGTFESGTCIFTGKPSQKRVIFAKSY
jgi:prolyl-tRNA synthetase